MKQRKNANAEVIHKHESCYCVAKVPLHGQVAHKAARFPVRFSKIELDVLGILFFQEKPLDICDDPQVSIKPGVGIVHMTEMPSGDHDHQRGRNVKRNSLLLDEGKDGESTREYTNGLPHNCQMTVDVVPHLRVHPQQKLSSVVSHRSRVLPSIA